MTDASAEKWSGGWGFQIDAFSFKATRDNFYTWRSTRKWLVDCDAKILRVNKGRRCWWPHAWVQVLGFEFGAGVYVDRGPFVISQERSTADKGE